MDEDSVNTLTLISQTNINDGAESKIFDFAERKHYIDLKKKDLDELITQFNFRREKLFNTIEEFTQTKNDFINKSNIFFREHQSIINNLKDEIRIHKEKLEKNEKNKEKVKEKIRFVTLSIETQNLNLRKLERTEKEIDEQMIFFQKIFKDSDIANSQAQEKENRINQIQKLIKGSETSIERYENLILKYELQISELKLKINECYEKQTDMTEQKNIILTKDKFHFIATKEKISQMKLMQSSKYNDDTNNIKLIEIGKNKIDTEQKIINTTKKINPINERLNEIKEEIQNKIKDIQNYHKLIEKPNNAIQKLRSRRIKREKFFKSKHDQFLQLKTQIESKKKFFFDKISELKKNELQLNSELKELNENILNEDLKGKELSLQNDIFVKENEKSRKIEIIQTKKSVNLLDHFYRKIELQKNQEFKCTLNVNINLKHNSNLNKKQTDSSNLIDDNKNFLKLNMKSIDDSKSCINKSKSNSNKVNSNSNENSEKNITTSKKSNSKSCTNKSKSNKINSKSSSELTNNNNSESKVDKNKVNSSNSNENSNKIINTSNAYKINSKSSSELTNNNNSCESKTNKNKVNSKKLSNSNENSEKSIKASNSKNSTELTNESKADKNKTNSKSKLLSKKDYKSQPLQTDESDSSKNLEFQIRQTEEATKRLRIEYSKAKQKKLRQHIEFQLFQLNHQNSKEDNNHIYKEIEKRIVDGRLLFLQRVIEMSGENKEIELLIQKKLEKIESIKNKLHNLKNEENTKNDLVVAYSPLDKKSFDYQEDSVEKHEMINWLFLMIKKEKEEWLRFHNNASIKSLLQVWNGFLDRM